MFGGSEVAAGSCTPKVETLVAEKREHDNQAVAELIAKGLPATRVVYEDGGQNPVFRTPPATTAFASLGKSEEPELPYDPKEFARRHLGEVSRPETLAAAGREIEVDAKGRPVMLAAAEAPIPTKAAAANLAKKGSPRSPKPEPVVAEPAKPARVMVADAEGDPAAYTKLLGNLFSNGAPATPAADAATIPPAVAADPAPGKPQAGKLPATKPAHVALAHAGATPAIKAKVSVVEEKAGKPVAKVTAPNPKATATIKN